MDEHWIKWKEGYFSISLLFGTEPDTPTMALVYSAVLECMLDLLKGNSVVFSKQYSVWYKFELKYRVSLGNGRSLRAFDKKKQLFRKKAKVVMEVFSLDEDSNIAIL